ncbi:MAG TPA: 3-deoxy-7-phosphoheptulonate synthase, partial [Ignavibacteriaceae bacterium]|nr:3-deoxy-7-phosphoheptulonate synthase [Ignavibacteriaceae bacterium]
SPKEHLDKVLSKAESNNCKPHIIYGTTKIAIGLTGETRTLSLDDFMTMDSVLDAMRISKNYKLVSREVKDETIIKINNKIIGDGVLQIIAGPCSVESKSQLFDIAGELKEMGITFFRAGAYKPRSSPYAFQGLKEKGLELLAEVKNEFGMSIVTEAKDTDTLNQVGEVADIIQIGARNMQNFSLLERVGELNKPVFLKRGLASTIEDLLMSAEYIVSKGNFNVILCERGIRTFETATRNTLDLNAIPVIKQQSHLPIFVDPSHGIGMWDKVTPMAMAAVAAGAHGLMIEVHNRPDEALSDGFQSLTPKNFKQLLNKVKPIAEAVNKQFDINC